MPYVARKRPAQNPLLSNAPAKRFSCFEPDCDREFSHKGSFNTHLKRHAGIKPHECSDCDAAFTEKKDLQVHFMQKHTNERPFRCSEEGCDAAFTTARSLKTHVKIHTGEKDFMCDEEGCDFACNTSSGLAVHTRAIHSDYRPFVCEYPGCDYACAASGSLSLHRISHMAEKHCPCSEECCDKMFKTTGQAKDHYRRVHSGVKAHTCPEPFCNFASAAAGDLTKHLRIHSGQKPYECNEVGCDYASASASNLKTHQLNHLQKRPYPCLDSRCDASFANASSMRTHYNTCAWALMFSRHEDLRDYI